MKEPLTLMRALAAAAALMLMATLLASSPAGAEEIEPPPLTEREPAARVAANAAIARPSFTLVPCVHFTDSIVRLYSAYFLRAPELGGFEFWQGEYEAGRWGLPAMSSFFSQSEEFVGLYGSLTDEEFIELIYQNIFGRTADAEGRDFWLGRMQRDGIDRGTWIVVQESTLRSGGILQAFGWALANNTITGLRFTADGEFSWSVAQSPTVTPETRAGW